MNINTTLLKIAGLINLFTALLHTIGGQLTLVNPLLESALIQQTKAEWIGAWHMVTILLWASSYFLLKTAFTKTKSYNHEMIRSIGILYMLMAAPSLIASIFMGVFAPQFILLFPIGLCAYMWAHKNTKG